jgi:hypothetical protein
MYVDVRTRYDSYYVSVQACCTPVAVNVTSSIGFNSSDKMKITKFDVSTSFACSEIKFRRTRWGDPSMGFKLRKAVERSVSEKVKLEVISALEGTYRAVLDDELGWQFPDLPHLVGTATSSASILPLLLTSLQGYLFATRLRV